jgi:glycosyltransferase involved in cell wall biosynthesis
MRLLLFNLATDADDPVLGFATCWIQVLAEHVEYIDVMTMRAGRLEVPPNVTVYSVGKEKGYSEPRRAAEFYRILFRLLREHRYDACFAHMMPLFAVMAAPVLRLKNIPLVLWYTHKSVTLTLRFAALLVNRIVTASQESFRIPSRKVRVIGHGIDTAKFVPAPHSASQQRPFTVLSVSRLSRIKRLDVLIDAVALLRRNKPELPLCVKIVGGPLTEADQEYVHELKQRVQDAHLQDVVEFVGSVLFHRIVPYYQQADCFVNMSETGSVDKAVLEAMSCEVAVVVNPVFTDILGDELAQVCIVKGDAEHLCGALLKIMSMPEGERRQLGAQLRHIVIRYHDLQGLCGKIVHELSQDY